MWPAFILMMVVMIMVVGFAVEVGNSAQRKKYGPAQVKRRKVIDRFADQQQDKVRQ